MNRRRNALLFVLLGIELLGCGRGSRPSPSAGDPPSKASEAPAQPVSAAQVQSPRFVWMPPFAVPVKDVGSRDGNTYEANFWLDVCRVDEKTISITLRDYKFALFNERPASDPALAPGLAQAEQAASAIPKMLVSTDGVYLGLEGLDEFVKRLAGSYSAGTLERVRTSLRDPKARAILEQSMGKYWQTWAGAWLAFAPEKGLEQKSYQAVPGAKSGLETETVFAWDGSSGFAQIRQSTRGDGDVIGVIAADMVAAFGAADLPYEELEGSFERAFETVTEWPGVRPRSASWRQVISVSLGAQSQRREERHEYLFDWEKSSAAAARCQ